MCPYLAAYIVAVAAANTLFFIHETHPKGLIRTRPGTMTVLFIANEAMGCITALYALRHPLP
jgi:hypothetical protein